MSLGSLTVGWQSYGASVLTIDDGGGAVPVVIPEGWYATPAALGGALESALTATWAGADVDHPQPGYDYWTITIGAGAFALVWVSDDLRDYMGFSGDVAGDASYTSDAARGSTWFPLAAFQSPVWRRVVTTEMAADHTGFAGGGSIGDRAEFECSAWVEEEDYDTACSVLRRMMQGARGSLRLDRTNANTWAWSAAAWTGDMTVALLPGRSQDLGRFLTEPWTGIREVHLSLARW